MADLLFNKKIIIIFLLAIFTQGVEAYESSFPFPFEFGHSSDIYLDVKKPETKQVVQQKQAAEDMLYELGISKNPNDFVKYIKKGDSRSIKLLLDAGFDPNTCINANYPLYYAARYKQGKIIYLLLESGADPNKDYLSPLRYTILNRDYSSTKLLLEKGADPNYTDVVTDESVLYMALKKKEYDIARMLIEKGAKPDRKSYSYISKKKLGNRLGVQVD